MCSSGGGLHLQPHHINALILNLEFIYFLSCFNIWSAIEEFSVDLLTGMESEFNINKNKFN